MSNPSLRFRWLPAGLAGLLLAVLLSVAAAQEPAPNRSAKLVAGPAGLNAAAEAIHRALDEKSSAEFIETPLADVAALISDKHSIPVRLDMKALRDAGIDADAPVTAHIENVSLRSLLKLALQELDCTFVVQHEVLLITTDDEADQTVETVVYDVLDLLADDRIESHADLDYNSLIEMVTMVVAPTTWSVSNDDITYFDGMLVILQTQEVHRQIVRLLADLRKVRAARPAQKPAQIDDPPDLVSLRTYTVQVPLRPLAGAAQPAPPASAAPVEKTPPNEVLNQLGGGAAAGPLLHTPDPHYLETLAETIRVTIEPQSWSDVGGSGIIRTLPANEGGIGTLVVKQTGAIHAQVEQLLEDINEKRAAYGGCMMGGGFF